MDNPDQLDLDELTREVAETLSSQRKKLREIEVVDHPLDHIKTIEVPEDLIFYSLYELLEKSGEQIPPNSRIFDISFDTKKKLSIIKVYHPSFGEKHE